MFLHATGEEHGLYGSRYHPKIHFSYCKIPIANINIDMIGRRDKEHADSNTMYVIGANRLLDRFRHFCAAANTKYTKPKFDKFNDPKIPIILRAPDHYNFAKFGIPPFSFI
jgi:Zn-dependent M28 family amino/carboxypeptidase